MAKKTVTDPAELALIRLDELADGGGLDDKTWSAVASELGVSCSTLSNWRNRVGKPRGANVLKLEAWLDSLDDIAVKIEAADNLLGETPQSDKSDGGGSADVLGAAERQETLLGTDRLVQDLMGVIRRVAREEVAAAFAAAREDGSLIGKAEMGNGFMRDAVRAALSDLVSGSVEGLQGGNDGN